MSGSLPRALFVSAAFICFSAAVHAADFGRTQGVFDVSASGAANYTIPIWTPPGPHGLQPRLELTYDSQSRNGVLGMGWSFSATSSIERCARTAHQDGSAAAVDLTMADRFCIGGNRLRLQSGTYGSASSVYFTEIADFSRITAYGTAGNGPQYFVVEAKSGLRYEFGATTDARVFAGVSPAIAPTPHRWMLNRVSDRNGNTYVVRYHNRSGFAVPDVISWTPTSFGASTYRYEARFNYINDRVDLDSYYGKVAGFDVANRYRLESLQISSAGVVKRKYRFTYDASRVTARSRLTSAKECADDAETNCFLPLTFSYQDGVAGVMAARGAVGPAGSSSNLVSGRYDFNGDGKNDILYRNGATWSAAFGAASGFAGPFDTGIGAATVLVDRFLPAGRDGIATVVAGNLWVYRWNSATSAFVGYNTGIVSDMPITAADVDGDRLADLVYLTSGSPTISVRRNASTGSGDPAFETTLLSSSLTGGRFFGIARSYFGDGLQRADVNGDGRQDIFAVIIAPGARGATNYSAVLLGSAGGLWISDTGTWIANSGNPTYPALDFNGDACTDRLVGSVIYVSACNGVAASTVLAPAQPLRLIDWDADGKTDILVEHGGNFGVYRATGAGFSGSMLPTNIASSGTCYAIDVDGDGLDDLVRPNGINALSYWTHTSGGFASTYLANVPDLLSAVSDGFGVTHTLSYATTSASHYDAGATTSYPLVEGEYRIVVAHATSSDGIGGTYNRNFFYTGARMNAERDEFAGFQRIDETDNRTGIITRTYRDQSFPLSGMVKMVEVLQPNGTATILRTVFTNSFARLDSTPNNQRYFVYPSASTTTQYEVGGPWNGSLLRTISTSSTYDNASGALYDQTVTTAEPASSANGASAGGSWTARTYTPLAKLLNDTPSWCIGRSQQIRQTNSHSLTFGAQGTRTTDITWNAALCRPTQSIAEPGNSTLEVKTDLGYDGFGNVSSTTVTGIGMPARTASASYSDATNTTGQFPLTQTNALGQTTSLTWNHDLGVPVSVKDPNGIATSWTYDPYGRRSSELRPDGTSTVWSWTGCLQNCGLVRFYIGQSNFAGTVPVTTGNAYFDQFDRPVAEQQRIRSAAKYRETWREYDVLGRVVREYLPYYNVDPMPGSVNTTYDLIGRVSTIARPMSDSSSTRQTTNLYYEGLTARVVDAQGIETKQIVNAAGQLVRSADHDGYYQAFDYDAFGNSVRVADSNGNTLQSSVYNARGMLTQRTDMDLGTWVFTPNALGETVSQIDARNQTTTFEYDPLGRLKNRVEAEGTSKWTWGDSSAARNIGRLASVSGPDYSESYSYDALGRLSNTRVTADDTYSIDYSYNALGLLDTLTYPTSTSGYRLKLQYSYSYGLLSAISNFDAPGTLFWSANDINARYQTTQEALGNGLVTSRAYDAVTGLVKSIQTGAGGGSGVQSLAYTWDLVGNLASRRDVNQSNLTETFSYDHLYRLDTSRLNGVKNLEVAYDALGNITSKSDVGTYTYHATKRHQVTATSNGWSFAYDNNGNMTSARGATISWTSYNYPAAITNGALSSSFSYTPDRRYWKQVSNYPDGAATTVYIGGLLEKATTGAGTDYRHMIRAGGATIIVSRQSGGANSIQYVTSDHLGSNSAITNASGGILANLSFDAFGKRRGSNWSGSPSASDWTTIANTTRRGFTDHSMLDNLGLIHMNGRVQDPALGRFLSADPFIPGARDTQSFNRYGYVGSNPVAFADPSGFNEVPGACVDTPLSPSCLAYVNEGHSSMQSDPCFFASGGSLAPGACFYITAQIGIGSALANTAAALEAAKHRGPPGEHSGDSTDDWQCVNPAMEWRPAPTTGYHQKAPWSFWKDTYVGRVLGTSLGDYAAIFNHYHQNPLTGNLLSARELEDAKFLALVNVATVGMTSDASVLANTGRAARGTVRAVEAPIEATRAGERFVRVGARPENLKMSFNGPGGTQAGTHAFPESTFYQLGRDPAALKNFGDLPGVPPQYFRILEPPPGTAIQRGIVPGGEHGGIGGVQEVFFPDGF